MLVKVGIVDLSSTVNENDRKLNVRINSDYTYKSIYELDDKEKVVVLDKDDVTKWYKISFVRKDSSSADIGWVSDEYIKISEYQTKTFETKDYIKLRLEPVWRTSRVLGVVSPNELVDVLTIENGWATVHQSGCLCYISTDVLKEVKEVEKYKVKYNTKCYTESHVLDKDSTVDISEIIGDFGIMVMNGRKFYIPLSSIEKLNGDLTVADKIVALAKAQLGKPYEWGEEGPESFDCSGLIWYVYKEVTGLKIPRVSRDMVKVGKPILSINDIQPADLLFFDTTGDGIVNHVGIYIGNNEMIHSPQKGDVVKIANITSNYWVNRYRGSRRIL